jgi:hypothetical protein
MALDQSALLEVLDVLKAAEVDDRIRQAAETIYQALIEAELSRPRRVASLPTVGGRATLQVMMRAVRRMQAAVDQARADLPDRQGSRKGFPCRRPAAAGSVGGGWR